MKTFANTDNKINRFVTVFATIPALQKINYLGLNPDTRSCSLYNLCTLTQFLLLCKFVSRHCASALLNTPAS